MGNQTAGGAISSNSATGAASKPYAMPTQWARMITPEGETISSSRQEVHQAPTHITPQIIYGADGTQYYAVPKASFAPTMATPGGSVIVSPTQVASPHHQLHSTSSPSTTAATSNYPAFVTVPISAAGNTAIFHPVAIPVQGMHTPAYVLRPPYSGSTMYQPMVHPVSTTSAGVYHSIAEHRAIEATAQAVGAKTESTNTIVKTHDGETIVIIQRPVEGGMPVHLKEGATATANNVAVAGHPHIYHQHHLVQQGQQEIKQILIEQPTSHHTQ